MPAGAYAHFTYDLSTIMGAGHETTANSLTWTLYELAKRPDLQTKLRDEVKDMEKAISGADFSVPDLESMPYLQAVMKVIIPFFLFFFFFHLMTSEVLT